MTSPKRLTGLGIAGGLALVAVVAVILLLLRAGQIEHGPIRSAEATRVAEVARRPSLLSRSGRRRASRSWPLRASG